MTTIVSLLLLSKFFCDFSKIGKVRSRIGKSMFFSSHNGYIYICTNLKILLYYIDVFYTPVVISEE